MKNSLLIHYFIVNLRFFHGISVCFENVQCKAFIVKINGAWNGSQTMWDSFQNSTIIAKNLHFYAFKTLAAYAGMCMCMLALARVRKPRPTYASRGPLWLFYFQK